MSIYLKLDDCKGNVTDKGYEGWITVYDLNFAGINSQVIMQVGKVVERNNSQPQFGQVAIIKATDNSSNQLFSAVHSGQVFKSAEFHIVKGGNNNTVSTKLLLSDVMVTHFSDDFNAESATGEELVRLAYTKMERTYIALNAKNKPSSPLISGYDLAKAQAL